MSTLRSPQMRDHCLLGNLKRHFLDFCLNSLCSEVAIMSRKRKDLVFYPVKIKFLLSNRLFC